MKSRPPALPSALLPADILFAKTAVCHVTAPCGQGYDDKELKAFFQSARSGKISFHRSIRIKEAYLEEQDRTLLEGAERFLLSGGKTPMPRDNVRLELLPRTTAKDALAYDLSYLLFIVGSDKLMELTGTKREDLLLRIGGVCDVLSGKTAGIFTVTPSFICLL